MEKGIALKTGTNLVECHLFVAGSSAFMLTSLKHHQTRLIIKNHRPLSRHTSACRKRPLPKSSSEVNHEALPYAPSNFASCDFNGGLGESLKFFFGKNGHTSEKK